MSGCLPPEVYAYAQKWARARDAERQVVRESSGPPLRTSITLQDDFLVIHIQNDYSSVLESVFKTEFLTTLSKRYKDRTQRDLSIKFSDCIEFPVKKEGWGGGGTRSLKFVKGQGDLCQLKPTSKACTVTIGPGLPNTSKPGEKLEPSHSVQGGRGIGRPLGPAPGRPQQPLPSRAAPSPPGAVQSRNAVPTKQHLGRQHDLRRMSRTRSIEKSPSLPKDGAAKFAKQINQAVLNNNNDFMKTPDAGVAGLERKRTGSRKPTPGAGRTKPKPKPPTKPKPLPVVTCLYAYDAQDTDELSFNEGDKIEIIREDPAGWWLGRLRGKEGLFPSNYIGKVAT